ncbi:hypothetical protein FV139_03460 [Parahaliea maris]|uniref:Uncharacterized protein n=1 Tax=Parahaliea maris TaxID=2716870 RepID=A0A5C9A6W9_9GAMM|nr:hypothetical protein [Parahaliea maris]TXS96548.1 hypothetical protein FV139_03460 [Parahaliea maris]
MQFSDYRWHALVVSMLLLMSCTLSAESPTPSAAELDAMGKETVSRLLEYNPELAASLESAAGYVVIAMASTKIPGVGAGRGYGVVTDNASNSHAYIRVTQFEAGGGIGAQRYRLLVVLEKQRLVNKFIAGGWRYTGSADVGASAVEGTAGPTATGKGYQVYRLTDEGAAATVTVRAMNSMPYSPDQ